MWDLVRMKFINVRNHCFVFEGFWLSSRVLIAHKSGKVDAEELGNALYDLWRLFKISGRPI
ncbi:hypothetical protein Hanom_Chr16g01432351 [Helianthus anomalus]